MTPKTIELSRSEDTVGCWPRVHRKMNWTARHSYVREEMIAFARASLARVRALREISALTQTLKDVRSYATNVVGPI